MSRAYEIRLAAPFADNLMNSVAHCGELPINVERQAPLYPSSATEWAQEIGSSFSVPFFLLNVGTVDRIKLLCTLLPPQREIVYGYEKLVWLLIPTL